MSKIRTDVARRRIESFENQNRFGKAHLYLAYHAAFPLALTPDLLYRLWAKFQRDIHGEMLNIPWIAVADLLLSNLCDEVGYELYEMDLAVRNLLLQRLQEDKNFGQQRINELSDFLLAYVRQKLQSDDPDTYEFAQTQRWVALAYTQPNHADRELALAFSKLNLHDKSEMVRMAFLTETFADPLAQFQPLLIYAHGMGKFARGNLDVAKAVISELLDKENQIRILGVNLPIPEQLKADRKKAIKFIPRALLAVYIGTISLSLSMSIYQILTPCPAGQQKNLGIFCQQDTNSISRGERTFYPQIKNKNRDQGIEKFNY
ncbi:MULTISPECIES: hypothetical protein [Calothrix]|uniref:Uncharacterized protein n=2 Tax=Calothrix TaxID=1186 RepID=A0ABR8A458_9CYAN|nr:MULTISPECIES: hypothetical protein [Calothrix]MBD2194260.1 hypothetical protein [Calothrix parietina FACHB-288]MBD2225056.1 hypothetical protein [Calothrix anomala FACHB-343]